MLWYGCSGRAMRVQPPDGDVQDVPHQEQPDDHSPVPHRAGRVGGSAARTVLRIAPAGLRGSRRASWAAATAWTTSATTSTTRWSQRNDDHGPAPGGRWYAASAAYPSKSAEPKKIFRLPTMCSTRNTEHEQPAGRHGRLLADRGRHSADARPCSVRLAATPPIVRFDGKSALYMGNRLSLLCD